MADDELSPIVTIDLRNVSAYLTVDEGDLIMLVDDGDVQVEFSSGLNGSREQAVVGAQRVASTALEFAARLRQHPARPDGGAPTARS